MICSQIAHGLLGLKHQGPFLDTTRGRRKSVLHIINARDSMGGFTAMSAEVRKSSRYSVRE